MSTKHHELVNPTGQQTLRVQADEHVTVSITDRDAGSRDFALRIELVGKGATCHVNGRTQVQDRDEKSLEVVQVFLGQDQTGSITLHGTAEDESHLHFNGSAILEPNSVDATANITEKIRLFDQAKAKALPVLTVRTDKVKGASHGASVAPVPYEDMLYMASRGIPPQTAKDMLKEGFLL